MDTLLTIQEVAEYLKVSPTTVRRLVVRRGSLMSGSAACYDPSVVTCSGGFRPERRAEDAKASQEHDQTHWQGRVLLPQAVRGRDVWISLGTDLSEAKDKLKKLRNDDHTPRADVSVREATKKWLEHYVATARNEKQQVIWLAPIP